MILEGITVRSEVGKSEISQMTRGPICPSISRPGRRHPREGVRSCYGYIRFVSNASNLPILVLYHPHRSTHQYPILAIRAEP